MDDSYYEMTCVGFVGFVVCLSAVVLICSILFPGRFEVYFFMILAVLAFIGMLFCLVGVVFFAVLFAAGVCGFICTMYRLLTDGE